MIIYFFNSIANETSIATLIVTVSTPTANSTHISLPTDFFNDTSNVTFSTDVNVSNVSFASTQMMNLSTRMTSTTAFRMNSTSIFGAEN